MTDFLYARAAIDLIIRAGEYVQAKKTSSLDEDFSEDELYDGSGEEHP